MVNVASKLLVIEQDLKEDVGVTSDSGSRLMLFFSCQQN